MDQLPVTEKDVQYILKNKEKLKVDIHRKMYSINKDMYQTEEMYELVAYPSSEVSDMPRRKGWHKDLGDVVLRYKALLESKKKDYQEFLWEQILKEQQIDRVWLCFQILEDPCYSIIDNMYVKGEKYETAEQQSGFSRQVFEKYRKRGIDTIIFLYNSNKTIHELSVISQGSENNRKSVEKEQFANRNVHQMSIEDILISLQE